MKKLKEIIDHFLVYKCAGCSDTVKPGNTLCDSCRVKLMQEMRSPCPVCHVQQIECSCLSNGRKNSFDHVMHVSSYRKGNVTYGIVTGCKKVRDNSLMDFVAYSVQSVLASRITLDDKTCIIPIPRSLYSKRDYGFDQSEYVSKKIAEELGIECICAIDHLGCAVQKTLNYRQRLKNASESFVLKDGINLSDRHIVLYDDVTTTGASAVACEKLIRKCGAETIDFISFARSE